MVTTVHDDDVEAALGGLLGDGETEQARTDDHEVGPHAPLPSWRRWRVGAIAPPPTSRSTASPKLPADWVNLLRYTEVRKPTGITR